MTVVRVEIEREAQTRRNAIAAIFNEDNNTEPGDAPTRTTSRRVGKPNE